MRMDEITSNLVLYFTGGMIKMLDAIGGSRVVWCDRLDWL